ncbi:MAG: hypothetical protein M1826_003316 [Phylliscum demangeonii]|nr:MAG: hypothetical protein M1826_003316 [Phylliscum demangeonii]
MSVTDLGRDYSRYPTPLPAGELAWSSQLSLDIVPSSPSRTPASALSPSLSNPLRSSTAGRSSESELEKAFSPFLDDRIAAGAPYAAGPQFPLLPHEKELDDDLHMPHPDDDRWHRPRLRDCTHRRGIASLTCLAVMVLGAISVFIILPVLTFTGYADPAGRKRAGPVMDPNAFVIDRTFPLFEHLRRGLVDPDTPTSAMTRRAVNGDTLELVFSDEFNRPNRTFYPGDDPYFTAPDLWYGATQDIDWYDPDAASTAAGTLNLQLDRFPNHGLQYRSGMLNSWNQLCFKGGVFEVSLSLPGPAGSPGLWPGIWTMGNLGRPGYKASTEGVWPYTYSECDAGITPNQSAPDGLSHLPGQKLAACTCAGEDHPSPGTGRGAPEIDVIEASVDPINRIGVVTQSAQVAPFDVWYRPNYDFLAIGRYETTQMNDYCGGPFQQAISGTTLLNNTWYDGQQYQKYAFEYTPGTDQGAIAWFVGDQMTFAMSGSSIGPNGNVGRRQVSEEPMSIILNLGFSEAWTWIDYAHRQFPTTLRIDYVRWYQKPGYTSVSCDPPGYPTTEYIAQHPRAYQNPNLTSWDETGYGWPRHKLNSDCA